MSNPVHEWIEKAFEIADRSEPLPLFQSRTLSAWCYLKDYRDRCDPADLHLACAEHYMFARWVSSMHPAIGGLMPVIVGAYQLNKVIRLFLREYGIQLGMHYGQSEPTPPSSAQVLWGLRGCARGFYGDFGFVPSFPVRGFVESVVALGRQIA